MGWTKWNGNKAKELAKEVAQKATYAAGTAVLQESKQQVPHDEGILEGSGKVFKDPQSTASSVSYGYGSGTGKPALPYAVKWHEVPANFQKGRKNHYLIDPLKNVGPNALKKAVKKYMNDTF